MKSVVFFRQCRNFRFKFLDFSDKAISNQQLTLSILHNRHIIITIRSHNYNTGIPRNSAKNKLPKTYLKQSILRLLLETKCYLDELYTTPYLAHQNRRKRVCFTSKCVQNRTQHLHFAQGSLKRLLKPSANPPVLKQGQCHNCNTNIHTNFFLQKVCGPKNVPCCFSGNA